MPLLLLLAVADGDEAPLFQHAAKNVMAVRNVLNITLFLHACR